MGLGNSSAMWENPANFAYNSRRKEVPRSSLWAWDFTRGCILWLKPREACRPETERQSLHLGCLYPSCSGAGHMVGNA